MADATSPNYSVFISFAFADKEFADRLHADLKNHGIRCWFAPQDVQAGKKLYEQLRQAIQEAGIGHKDVDHLMIYDAFAHLPIYGLEDLGFCGRGEAASFIWERNTAPGGRLPMLGPILANELAHPDSPDPGDRSAQPIQSIKPASPP